MNSKAAASSSSKQEPQGTDDADGDEIATQADIDRCRGYGLTDRNIQELKDVFQVFDADKSGSIDPKEIKEAMRSLGFAPRNETIYQLISDLDSDGSQSIEFDEFLTLMVDHMGTHLPENNTREDMNTVFDMFDDLNPLKRDGAIDVGNLERIARTLGDPITREELECMVKGAIPMGGGDEVKPEDFYQLMVMKRGPDDESEDESGSDEDGELEEEEEAEEDDAENEDEGPLIQDTAQPLPPMRKIETDFEHAIAATSRPQQPQAREPLELLRPFSPE